MYEEFNEVLGLARSGDLESVASILERLKPLILAQIRRYYNKREDYDDLISQGNLIILESLETFDEAKGVNFLGYVKCNLMYAYLDKHKDRKHVSLNSPLSQEGDGEMIDFLISKDQGPLEDFLDLEVRESLVKAMELLTPRQREVIYLFYFQGLSLPEVSDRLAIAYRTVINTRTAALNKMKVYFQGK